MALVGNADNTFYCNPDFSGALAAAGIGDAAALWAYRGRTVKDNFKERVTSRAELPLPDGAALEVFIKRYEPPTLKERLKNYFSGKFLLFDAFDEGRSMETLRERGIPVPRVLALGRLPGGATVIMIEGLAGYRAAWYAVKETSARAERRALLRRIAGLCAALHDAGAVHQDLYIGHVFVTADEGDKPHLIDLQRVLVNGARRERRVVKDVGQMLISLIGMGVSRSDCLCWWKTYRELRHLEPARARKILRAAWRKGWRIYRRSQRKKGKVGYEVK